jgi:large subunit ribosomal protein L4
MVQLALRSALSDRAAEGRVAVVDSWGLAEPSTKGALAALAALEITGKVLVVLPRHDEAGAKSFRNLPHVHVMGPGELNTYDVLRNDWVVFTPETLPGQAETTPTSDTTESDTATGDTADSGTATSDAGIDQAGEDGQP